ncbi:sensor histidine kinase [Amycolatopsis acidicola]|uniref:histidine kinase n=1 Tax=Amycolatopsis acidicola TaxID=2596893 RepID=A0A5N0VDA5_9PSEU|nr:nitrate- and nitrite sensing domain-containing protein [Amycolatopsis acidicola]KAA9162642.1 sensor histidine kinase [Amycolatopsis acidicola]
MSLRDGLPGAGLRPSAIAGRLRPKPVRAKIVALLMVPVVSLMVLWALVTVQTVQQAWTSQQLEKLDTGLSGPVSALVSSLQDERATVSRFLSRPGDADQAGLGARHEQTEKALSALRDGLAPVAADIPGLAPEVDSRLSAVIDDVAGLRTAQAAIADRRQDWPAAFEAYSAAIRDTFAVESALRQIQNEASARTALSLSQVGEMLARQDAVLTSQAGGRLNAGAYRVFIDALGGQRTLSAAALADLPEPHLTAYRQLLGSEEYRSLSAVQDTVAGDISGRDTASAIASGQWASALDPVLTRLATVRSGLETAAGADAAAAAESALTRGAVIVLLGLLAVLLALVISVRIGRGLVVELVGLRDSALELANRTLPGAMRRLRAGEKIDVDSDVPLVTSADGEIGQVGDALNAVRRSALNAAAERAELLTGVSGVFVTLARRSQTLLHRQLSLLDEMERRTDAADDLEDLFRLDHLAARMRRHAEGLIIMSGATAGQVWSQAVPLMTVARAAVAEVEQFHRVEVRRMADVSVQGAAVADLRHLLAELVENATSFSPPTTTVLVHGEQVGTGFVIEIEDRGLGLSPESLAQANIRLAEAHQLELFDSDQLGFFVISRLAQRQGITVTLRRSAYGGTSAVVLLANSLLSRHDEFSPHTGTFSTPRAALATRAQVSRRPAMIPARDPVPPDRRLPAVPAGEPVFADDATGGLPRRTRQASLAPGLRNPGDEETAPPVASPEQARATMSALQQGFLRGRNS